MLRYLAGFLFLITAAASGATDSTYTYRDAVRYALDHAPSLQTAKARAAISELNSSTSFAGFLPSLDLTSTHGYLGESPKSAATATTSWSSTTGLKLTETLWDNGETYTKYRIARLLEDRASLDLKNAREKVVLDLHQEYQRYSLAVALNTVEQDQFALLKKQYDMMSQQFRAGMKSREDYIRVQAQVQRAELALLKTANDVERSKRELVRILGVPTESQEAEAWKFTPLEAGPIRPEEEPKAPPSPTTTLAYQANGLQRKANELTTTLTSRKWWPQLSLTGNLGYELNGYLGTGARLADTDRLSYGAGLTLTFNLWDWGVRARDTQVAERNQWIQDRDLASQEQSDRASIETLWLELGRAKKSYSVSKELLGLETANFKTLEADYKRGAVRYLDLITALKDLATAKSAYLSAYFEYRQNLALHRFYEGKLYETTLD